MLATRLEVETHIQNHKLDNLINEAGEDFDLPILNIKEIFVYRVSSAGVSKEHLHEVFIDEVIQSEYIENDEYDFVIEISYRAGVTDNSSFSAKDVLKIVGVTANVASSKLYFITSDCNKSELENFAKEVMANELIQKIDVWTKAEFKKINRFENISLPVVELGEIGEVEKISLDISDDEMLALSQTRCLAMSLAEMHHMRDYFEKLGRKPTDVELEVIAQSWSEHCKHKIFNAKIKYNENELIDSLYKTYIKGATAKIKHDRKLDWLISVFTDNAGIVRFDDNIDLCIKAETHNSPSALDPYGGALTGILGVNRDILGCGQGAKPIANMDIFCFAEPSMPRAGEEQFMPSNLKPPKRIFEGVHQGVEDGGNKSGIPTVNGAIFFDRDYAGKPLVFVGTVGAMPANLPNGQNSSDKRTKVNDVIVVVGGAIGADGIHGATFSSLELNEHSPATAVQIGDPLTQKRVTDFLIEARDAGFYSGLTDNGAGGLSSSVGEMATLTGGAELDLSLCPVKYPGLKPYELMISESQERMTFSVPPEKIVEFMDLAKRRGVVATQIGKFNDSGNLSIYYGDDLVGELDLEFLHDSLPKMQLTAYWDSSKNRAKWSDTTTLIDNRGKNPNLQTALERLMGTPNIASKEKWVRRYDHEVQASTHIKPFIGKECDGPADSGVVWLYPHGGGEENAVAIGCGLAPRMSFEDPYYMAQFAVDEAIRNVVVSGGDIDKCCLLDNFCWPDPVLSDKNPEGDYKLGQLVRSCKGLYDICTAYGTPLVSGKDSMKNDYRGKNAHGDEILISIPPTLMVTAMAHVKMGASVSSDFKQAGDIIYLLGDLGSGLAASEFAEQFKLDKLELPKIDIEENVKLYRLYRKACEQGLLQSGHDISDGGLLCAVAESAIGGRLGAKLDIEEDLELCFNEAPSRFIVSVNPENKTKFESHFSNYQEIGIVTDKPLLTLGNNNWKIENMVEIWQNGVDA